MIEKVISGGQTGVDRAAWDAALATGIETGGFMPPRFEAEDGLHPEFASRYGAAEFPGRGYPARTRANVLQADMTVVMGDIESRGSLLAFRTAAEGFLPAFGWCEWAPERGIRVEFDCPSSRQRKWKRFPVVRTVAEAADLIRQLGPRTVNIGGNRASRAPGIYDWAHGCLRELFADLTRINPPR